MTVVSAVTTDKYRLSVRAADYIRWYTRHSPVYTTPVIYDTLALSLHIIVIVFVTYLPSPYHHYLPYYYLLHSYSLLQFITITVMFIWLLLFIAAIERS